VLAFDVFEREIRHAIGADACIVESCDSGVHELGENVALALQSFDKGLLRTNRTQEL
jgi:hypothetical protein